MLRLNSRQWMAVVATLTTVLVFVTVANHNYAYSLSDISSLINSLELSSDQSASMLKSSANIVDNNSPEMIAKHQIENQVNELLKAKLKVELEEERKDMKAKLADMNNKMRSSELELVQAKLELGNMKGLVQVARDHYTSDVKGEEFRKHVYAFRTTADDDGNRLYDSSRNELVILSSFTNTFGRDRTYEDFFVLLDSINAIAHPKTSISLLIGDEAMFNKIDRFVDTVFKSIQETKDLNDLQESFSKITLIHAPFLEDQLSLSRGERQKAELQKQRRRVLAQMRNFLVSHGIENEVNSIYLDSDVIELPKDMLKHFLESGVDVATVRIDMKNPQGQVTHPDYDLNAWAGSRIKPTLEQEKQMDENPDFFFEPRPAEDAIHMLDLSSNREKYGLDDKPNAKYELKSVGGAVLFAKCNVYRQGATFPPYYAVGTTWDRKEGWDGVETEGLCYIANAIGYKCWGFPNLIGYHTV